MLETAYTYMYLTNLFYLVLPKKMWLHKDLVTPLEGATQYILWYYIT